MHGWNILIINSLLFFQEAEAKEMTMIKNIRSRNLERNKKCGNSANVKLCVCGRNKSAGMLRCELCYNWYHRKYIFTEHSREIPLILKFRLHIARYQILYKNT